ncbi:Sodium-coupled monocarboxylate transporter 2 [Armadillidium nasatum]|uniref:Sodium-coupled monocarboxylate transporter 2 n=1 Tax=Armadillidium nasatum TaxID=96803 RepID=A0A5N5SP59_9CRUS|nr:Sodium-coupled monocarboxylate transporter 2 [Armadillidium nasatum]
MIVDKLSHIYGLPGVYVATMIASTLSTFSSVLNAMVALIWRDFFCRFPVFANSEPIISAVINKVLTLIVGCGFIAMAFVTSKAGSIIQLVLSVGGIIFGSVLGIFVLGMCFPKSNWKGAWCGFTGSVDIFSMVQSLRKLSYSTSLCENMTIYNWTLLKMENPMTNFTDEILFLNNEHSDVNEDLSMEGSLIFLFRSFSMYFFDISYTLYSVIAPLLSIIIGVIVSYLTRDKETHEVPTELLSPIILRFYGKKYLIVK